jgi:hypothetical protein
MSNSRRRTRILLAVGLLGSMAFSAVAIAMVVRPQIQKQDSVWTVEHREFRYEFSAVWRSERLLKRNADGAWEEVTRPADALVHPLRSRLLARLNAGTLEDIPREGQDELEALKTLGYL